MRRRAALAGALSVAGPVWAAEPRALRSVEGVRAFLTGAFPLGTPAEAVLARLAAEGIAHSPLVPSDGTIHAIWRDVGLGLLVRRSVTAVLRFREGRLAAIEVEDVYTGL